MDKHHKIRILVAKLSGVEREKEVMRLCTHPELIARAYDDRLCRLREKRDGQDREERGADRG